MDQEPDTSHIDQLAEDEAFKTPEGYFKNFPSRMENLTQGSATGGTSSIIKTVIRQIATHPWVASAAAATLAGITAMTITFTGNDPDTPAPTQPQNDATIAQVDSSGRDSSVRAEKSYSDKDNLPKQKDRKAEDTAKETDNVTTATGKENKIAQKEQVQKNTRKDTAKQPVKSSAITDMEQEPRYADNSQQSSGTQKSEESVHQAGSGKSKESSNQKSGISGKDIEFDLGNDTCIISPHVFELPEVPREYQAEWDSETDSANMKVSESGNYSATVYNKQGEVIRSDQIKVKYLPKPRVTLSDKHTVCKDKNLKLDPGFYSKRYEFKWSDGVESPVNFVNATHAGKRAYTLKITGCRTYEYKTIVKFEICDLEIPNFITPNGDGKNDYFVIEGLNKYPGSKLILFDRNNNKVFESNNYQNDFDGNNLPQGSYYYILKVNNKNQTTKEGILSIVY